LQEEFFPEEVIKNTLLLNKMRSNNIKPTKGTLRIVLCAVKAAAF